MRRIPAHIEEQVRKDLIMGHFIQRFLACRSHEALGREFGMTHNAIRKIESGKTRQPSLLPEQVESLRVARKQYSLLAPLRSRYTKNGIAKHYGISHWTVRRIERDLFRSRSGGIDKD